MKTDYRNKRGIVIQNCSASPLYNLLNRKDFQSLVKGMMKKSRKRSHHSYESLLLEELNQMIYSSAFLSSDTNMVSTTDKKLLMMAIQKHATLLLDDIHILLQHGTNPCVHLPFPYDNLYEQLQKLCIIAPSAIKYLKENQKSKPGNKSRQVINVLISQLIVLYEKITGKKAKENFSLPKAHSLPYTGELYDFIYRVFKMIEQKLSKAPGSPNNPYKINLHTHSLALGKRIEKNLKKPAMVLLFKIPISL